MNRLLIQKVHSFAQLEAVVVVGNICGPKNWLCANGKAHAFPSNQMVEWKISNQR